MSARLGVRLSQGDGSVTVARHAAPLTVSNWAADIGSPTEFHLTWTPSTDNADVQADLHYEVYVNGVLSDVVAGKTQSVNYGVFGQNTVEVFAVDSNGNKSAAATTTIVF